MNKFKLQILGTVSALIIGIVALLLAINYTAFKNESVNLNKQILRQKNSVAETAISERIKGYSQIISAVTISANTQGKETLPIEAINQLKLLQDSLQAVSEGAYIINIDGDIFNYEGKKLDFNVKKINRDYYEAMFMQGKTFFISSSFKSAVTDKDIVVFAHKIDNNTAAIASVYLKDVLGSTANRNDMILYSKTGVILSAPYTNLLGKNIASERPLYEKFNADSRELQYNAKVNGKNTTFTAFWGQLDVTGWEYVTFIEENVIEKNAATQLFASMIAGFICLILALGILIYTINKLVLKPVGGAPEEIAMLMEKMAAGNLTQNLQTTGKETGIYLSFINLSFQLSELIKNSHGISESVASASQQLNATMTESKSNSQNELAQVEQISTAINELSSASQEVSSKAVMAEEETKAAQESVKNGKLTLEKNIALTGEINTSVSDTADIVKELREFAVEIGSVTEVIDTISQQTNLLALNAAIDAARAGEHGRGFAVVADEVRNLASKTQESTVSIQKIIENLQSQSEKANDNMTKNVELIEEYILLTEHVKTSFEDISTAVESISEINALVATASQEQNCVTEDISKNTTQTFDLVQQNVAAVNESLQAATELAEMAEAQKNELAYFRV